MSERIRVTVYLDGSIHAETLGMPGDRCLTAFEVLESLVDATVVDSTYTENRALSDNSITVKESEHHEH
jgi:hypothetical protein